MRHAVRTPAPTLLLCFLLVLSDPRRPAVAAAHNHRMWDFKIRAPANGSVTANGLVIVELEPVPEGSPRDPRAPLANTTWVCTKMWARADPGRHFAPMCFVFGDQRWASTVVDATVPESWIEIEAWGWAAGPGGLYETGAETWRTSTTFYYQDRALILEEDEEKDLEVMVSTQESLQPWLTVQDPKHTRLKIESPIGDHEYVLSVGVGGSFSMPIRVAVRIPLDEWHTLVKGGEVCTSLEHVPSGESNRACFDGGDIGRVWSKDHAELGMREGEFCLNLKAYGRSGEVVAEAKSRFTVRRETNVMP